MKTFNSIYFGITKTNEERLFKEANIYFDTSSLLAFYQFSDNTKRDIFDKVFGTLRGRLFVTHQTAFEFHKNKDTVARKPLQSYYDLLKRNKDSTNSGHIEEIKKIIEEIKNRQITGIEGHLNTLTEKTSKDDKHPFFDENIFDSLKASTEKLKGELITYETAVTATKDKLEGLIEEKKNAFQTEPTDIVLDNLNLHLTITENLSHSEILEIVKEGRTRFRNEIPPGYLDYEEKEGFQKFGDLISWKELLQHSRNNKKSVILVINDMKDDWWSSNSNPRYELIKEVWDYCGVNFWMFDLNKFLFKSNLYLAQELQPKTLEEAKEITPTEHGTLSFEDQIVDDAESRDIKTSYLVSGFRDRISRDRYVYMIMEKLSEPTEFNQIKPVIFPSLLRSIFPHLKLGDSLYMMGTTGVVITGHFAGFRSDDMAINIHPLLRRLMGVEKGSRYTIRINAKKKMLQFSKQR